MYDSIMLTVVAGLLLWIALGLQIIASSIRLLGMLFKPYPNTTYKIRNLERNTVPWIAKVMVLKVASYAAIRYISKKMK